MSFEDSVSVIDDKQIRDGFRLQRKQHFQSLFLSPGPEPICDDRQSYRSAAANARVTVYKQHRVGSFTREIDSRLDMSSIRGDDRRKWLVQVFKAEH